MFQFTQNETTASRRRIFFYAVSASDGFTAVTTGLSTSTSVYIVKNGVTPGTTPVSPAFTHIDSGLWYYEMTAANLDSVGVLNVRISDALIRTVQLVGYVYSGDPLTALPTFPANFSSLAITGGGAVTVGAINAGVITATSIATDAIQATKIQDGALVIASASGTGVKAYLAANAIAAGNIAADALQASKFQDSALVIGNTAGGGVKAYLSANAVNATVLADNAITNAKIANNAITDTKIAADAITNAKIADSAITIRLSTDVTASEGRLVAGAVANDVWNAVVHTYDGTSSNTTGTFGKALLRSDQSSKNGDVTMYSISGTNGIDVDIHRIDNDATAAINLKTLLMNTGTITLGGQFDTTGNTAITKSVWNQLRSTASPTSGIPAAGTFGYYLDQQVSTVSGGGGITAADVWTYGGGRSLTDKTGFSLATAQSYNNTGSVGSVTGSVGSVTGSVTVGTISADAVNATALSADACAEIADAILNRNIATGSSTGRTVKDVMKLLRNKVTVSATTLTVYEADGTSIAWTAAVTSDIAAIPITGVTP